VDEANRNTHACQALHAARSTQIDIVSFCVDDLARAHHGRQMPEHADVVHAKQFLQVGMKRLVDLRVFVEQPVHECGAMADGIAAAFVVIDGVEAQRFVEQIVRPAFVLGIGGEIGHAQVLHDVGNVQPRLDAAKGARHRMRRDLGNHRGAHALQSRHERHAQREAAHAVAERLDGGRAGHLANLRDGCGNVLQCDLVDVGRHEHARHFYAHAQIDEPYVVTRGAQIFDQIGADQIRRVDATRHAGAVNQQHGARVLARRIDKAREAPAMRASDAAARRGRGTAKARRRRRIR